MPSLQPTVRAQGLTHYYGDRTALNAIDFEIKSNQIYGFLGPNGSGKSTLFRLLSTLIRPQEGHLQLLGFPLESRSLDLTELRRQLGVVFQYPSLDLDLTVDENLILQGRLFGLRGIQLAKRIDRLYEQFDLATRRSERTKDLSGGLRRRVELSKALVGDPSLLLLDEPSTGLDPTARRIFWNLLSSLRDTSNITILLTTHFLEEAKGCDGVLMLNQGQIVAEGQPEILTQEIASETLTLITTAPSKLLRILREEHPSLPEPWIVNSQIRIPLAKATAWGERFLAAYPDWVTAFTVSRPTLEDVFLLRTGRELEGGDEP